MGKLLAGRLEQCAIQRVYIPENMTRAKTRARIAIIVSIGIGNEWCKETYIRRSADERE
jgi:hypothetical protein